MKKYIYITMVLAFLTSCAEKEFAPDTTLHTQGQVSLCASVEQIQTKMTQGAYGEGYWHEGDKIAVACSDGSFVEFTLASEGFSINGVDGGAKKAIFTGMIPEGKTLGSVAVWPAECAVAVDGNEVKLRLPESVALVDASQKESIAYSNLLVAEIGSTWDIEFKYAASRFLLNLTNVNRKIVNLELSAAGVKLGGEGFTFYRDSTGVLMPQEGEGSVVIDRTTSNMEKEGTVALWLPVGSYDMTIKAFARMTDSDVLDECLVQEIEEEVVLQKGNDELDVRLSHIPIKYDKPVLPDVRYVEVCGVKWATGNLRCIKGVTEKGFQEGWSLAEKQWMHMNYDMRDNTVGKTSYFYDDETPTEMRYYNSSDGFEHFNFGGLGRNARFYSSGNYIVPYDASGVEEGKTIDISGKLFYRADTLSAQTLVTDPWDILDGVPGSFSGLNSEIYGDVAFWASKGAYRLPTFDEMCKLRLKASVDFGHVKVETEEGPIKVWGVLFTNPVPSRHINKGDREFTAEEIATGVFLPKAGRRTNATSNTVIQMRKQGYYWTGEYLGLGTNDKHYSNVFVINGEVMAMYRAHKNDGNSHVNGAYDNGAGFLIRPVVNEGYALPE